MVVSSEFDAEKTHAMTTTLRQKGHANWDSTDSLTQFELTGDALFKVCTRVLRHSVPLPLRPDSFILTPQLLDDMIVPHMAMGSKRVD